MRADSATMAAYTLLVGLMLGARALVEVFPISIPTVPLEWLLSWPVLLGIALVGGPTIYLGSTAGMNELWNDMLSDVEQWYVPALVGILSGTALIWLDLFTDLPLPQLPLPVSLPYFVAMAIALELLLRLIPITAVTWLIQRQGGSFDVQLLGFWVVALLTAAVEPFALLGFVPVSHPAIAPVLALFVGVNLVEAYLFRVSGLASPLLLRLSLYLVWYVGYGGVVA